MDGVSIGYNSIRLGQICFTTRSKDFKCKLEMS